MFRKSWIILGGLIVCLALLFTSMAPSVGAQPNIAKVIITDLIAEERSSNHPLITAYVSVLDRNGAFVPGLEADDFRVKEFTKSISEFSVSEERQGVAIALLVDVSGSMEDRGLSDTRLKDAQETVKRFIERLDDKDMVATFTFCKEVKRVQPLTAGQEGMESWATRGVTIPSGEAGQYTSLFDAMYDAISELTGGKKELGREFARMKKAIFVFSDGMDNASLHDLFDVKRKLLAEDPKGKISIYAVGVGSEEIYDTYKARFDDLINLADVTKGRFIHYFGEGEEQAASARRELDEAFDRFLSQGEQYVIRYGTEACADQVTLSVEVGGEADEEEVKIPPVSPIPKLSGVREGQTVSGKVDLKTEFLLAQCPIREVTYFVNGVKMDTVSTPFTWKWDTSKLPDNPNAGPMEVDSEGNGLIKNVIVRVEAIDQKKLSGTDEVSGLEVKILHPEVEVLAPVANEIIERRRGWLTIRPEDTVPKELPVEIRAQPRGIKQVKYYLDGQLVDTTDSLESHLDISTLGTVKTQHTLKVQVVDELGLFTETEVTINVHIEGIIDFLKRQLSTLLIALGTALGIALGALALVRGPQMVPAPIREAFIAMTEALGIVEKAELLEIEDGEVVNRYRVRQQMNFGRDPRQADITFDDLRVSRLHASLVKEGEDFVLYDRASKYGTWVNEQRLRFRGSQVLESGDVIGLGPAIRLRFVREGGPGAEIEEE